MGHPLWICKLKSVQSLLPNVSDTSACSHPNGMLVSVKPDNFCNWMQSLALSISPYSQRLPAHPGPQSRPTLPSLQSNPALGFVKMDNNCNMLQIFATYSLLETAGAAKGIRMECAFLLH